MWNPSTVLPSRPVRSSFANGQVPKRSALGHGMCQNVITVDRGRRSRMRLGASAKW